MGGLAKAGERRGGHVWQAAAGGGVAATALTWTTQQRCRWTMMSDSRCGGRGVQEEGGTQGGWRAS